MTTKSRTPARLAADAHAAYDRLIRHQPDGIDDDVYTRYLAVLKIRMGNQHATNLELAAAMDQPLSTNAFNARLKRAIAIAGVIREPSGVSAWRKPPQLAAEARAAYDRLTQRQADRHDIDQDVYDRQVAVLRARMNDHHSTNTALAAAMDPPLPPSVFFGRLQSAINGAAGVSPRSPGQLAVAARDAYNRLADHRPVRMDHNVYARYLAVLHARMNDHHASNAELAAAMDPPLTRIVFASRLQSAINASTRKERPLTVKVRTAPKRARRTPAQCAADARAAYDQLIEHRPAYVGDDAMNRHLTVLQARMNNHHASNAELAAAMDPPQKPNIFTIRVQRAIFVASRGDYASAKRTPRSPMSLAADSRTAYDRLVERRPSNISDDIYARYLEVLHTRMNNHHASNAELAAAMDPPMSKNQFNAIQRRAIAASTRKPTKPSPPPRRTGIAGPHAARQATEAAAALAVLKDRRPDHITETRYRTLLTVLAARMNNPTATYRQLAAELDPPVSTAWFHTTLQSAHQLAGVDQTLTPYRSQREDGLQRNSAA
jgi:arginyl-tRNA--protein-N-Asp/Glu arginylyltransferase